MIIHEMRSNPYRINNDGSYDLRYREGRARAKNKKQVKNMLVKRSLSDLLFKWLIIALAIWSGYMLITTSKKTIGGTSLFGITTRFEAKAQEPIKTVTPAYCIGDVEELICSYDWDDRLMVAIAKAENGYGMYGSWGADRQYPESNGTVSTGIFMINSVHGIPLEELIDVEKNIAHAYKIWKSSGITAWGVWNNSSYLEFF